MDRRGWIAQLVVLVAMTLVVYGGFTRLVVPSLQRHAAARTQAPHPAGGEGRVQSATEVEFVVREGGRQERVSRVPARAAGLSGLSAQQVQHRYPGWRLEAFTDRRIVLVKEVASSGPVVVGVKDGQVAIFFGPPGSAGTAVRLTGIEVSRLQPADRSRVTRGIRVASLRQAWQILQGLGGV